VAVDGKCLRGSRSEAAEAVTVLGAMPQDGTPAAQQRVPDMTNEITGFAALLSGLDLAGAVVTADALHTQREHAEILVGEMGADYIFVIKRHRTDLRTGKRSRETVYAITSMGSKRAGGRAIAEGLRGHWGIENKIHYVRDVSFGEDASRIRTGHGPQNMATLRSVAMNFLRKTGSLITDARRQLALTPHSAPLDLFGVSRDLHV
jgi:predicted transposase YbfD/YdcC